MKKRKFNKNIILFFLCFLIVFSGYFSEYSVRPIVGSFFRVIKGQYTVDEAKNTINEALTDDLSYHDNLIDVNGLKDNIVGTRVVKKGDSSVIKADSGSLVWNSSEIKSKGDLKIIAK